LPSRLLSNNKSDDAKGHPRSSDGRPNNTKWENTPGWDNFPGGPDPPGPSALQRSQSGIALDSVPPRAGGAVFPSAKATPAGHPEPPPPDLDEGRGLALDLLSAPEHLVGGATLGVAAALSAYFLFAVLRPACDAGEAGGGPSAGACRAAAVSAAAAALVAGLACPLLLLAPARWRLQAPLLRWAAPGGAGVCVAATWVTNVAAAASAARALGGWADPSGRLSLPATWYSCTRTVLLVLLTLPRARLQRGAAGQKWFVAATALGGFGTALARAMRVAEVRPHEVALQALFAGAGAFGLVVALRPEWTSQWAHAKSEAPFSWTSLPVSCSRDDVRDPREAPPKHRPSVQLGPPGLGLGSGREGAGREGAGPAGAAPVSCRKSRSTRVVREDSRERPSPGFWRASGPKQAFQR